VLHGENGMTDEVINKKEKLLIELAISDPEVYAACYNIVKPEYFEAPLDRVVEYINNHFIKYGAVPNVDIIDANVGVGLKQRQIDDSEIEYFLDDIEAHAQEAAMSNAIMESVDLVNSGNLKAVDDLVKEALMVKLDSHIGINLFDDPEERINSLDENVKSFSCGIPEIDELIGRYRRGEFHVCYAVSSGGKSIWLGWNAIALAKQHLDVAVISLELNEQLYAKRLDAMLTQMDIKEHGKKTAKQIADKLGELKKTMGNITIKEMPNGSTVGDISAWLLEYKLLNNKMPDVLIVDYLHLMGLADSRNKNRSDIDDELSKSLRRLGQKHDMITLSAQQVNREGQDVTKINASHVSGGIVVVNNSDSAIYFAATEEDLDNNQVSVGAMKQRNASRTAKQIILYRCPKTLNFSTTPFVGKAKASSPVLDRQKEKVDVKSKDKLKQALKLRK